MKPGGQRVKGRAYEQKIAALMRARWPEATIRRAAQGAGAYEPDVFVEGGPALLQRLWLELEDSAHPNPKKKLLQASNDVARDGDARGWRIPVAVTHKLRSASSTVTLYLDDLIDLCGSDRSRTVFGVASMDLIEFFDLIDEVSP